MGTKWPNHGREALRRASLPPMRTSHRVSHSGVLGRTLGAVLQVAAILTTLHAVAACGSKSASAGVAPAITTPPASVSVPDGAVASFSVTATGDAPLAYQWRRNGVDLVDGAGINGATTPALALTAPIAFDKSLVSVRVSNGSGAVVSADALLTVTAAAPAAPVITTQPGDAMVMAGTTASFAVATSGGTAPITYQWKRNGVTIAGATSAMYTTPATLTTDTGTKYSVDVVNPVGTVPSNDALLTVIAGAGAWGPVVAISSGDLNSSMQANGAVVAIDSTGAAVAAWQQASGARNAVWGNSANASGTWSTAAPIDLPAGGNATPPRVGMTGNGSAIAVFGQGINGSVGDGLVASRFGGGVWTAAETIVAGDVDSVSSWDTGIASDGAATATFLQTDATMKRVRGVRSTSADVWGTPAILDVAGGDVPKLAMGANGHSVAVWIKNNGPLVSELWSSHDVGLGFALASMITADTSHSTVLEVTADAAGNVIAIWSQLGVSGNYVVRSARLDDATGAWSAPASLSDGTRLATASKPAVNSKGDAAVVWYEQGGGLYASTYSAAKATWTPAVLLPMTVSPTYAPLPTTTIDDAGNAIAVWLQYVSGAQFPHVFHAIHIAGLGKWTTPATLMTDPTAYCADAPVVTLNAKGFATAVWHQLTPSPATAPIVARAYR
jgi:hypothetical protein